MANLTREAIPMPILDNIIDQTIDKTYQLALNNVVELIDTLLAQPDISTLPQTVLLSLLRTSVRSLGTHKED
jgi:hypothetical protein